MYKVATKHANTDINLLAMKEAQESLTKIITLKPFLSPRDEETLALMADKKLMRNLSKSLCEAQRGELEPLSNILE